MPYTVEATRPARMQDLAAAVLAIGDAGEVLEMLVSRTRQDLGADLAVLILPDGGGDWIAEVVEGEDSDEVLGLTISADSAWGRALGAVDMATMPEDDGELPDPLAAARREERLLTAPVAAGTDGMGALLAVLRSDAMAPADEAAARERLDAIAALVAIALDATDREVEGLDDERSRIARDLHDLAIQELFAVGMELETVQRVVSAPDASGLHPDAARAIRSSVTGVERAVAQIRQIVQSLRRDRPEATLTERLRHEAGIATAGLGFVPSLRLPADPAVLDTEVPDEIGGDIVAVVRECLANAARHAHASAVAVTVSVFSEGVDRVAQVAVSDNGRGIDPTVTRRSGLANMSARARRHQGWVDAIPLEPGTMISWRVTLPPR